ncbi:MAG: lytic transglycosylase domain-containing protein [Bacilli bacterium]
MKTLNRISLCLCVALIIYIFFSEIQSIKTEIQSIKTEKQFVPLTDFELIELAIIWQESKANPNPKYSDGKSEGILQITPIYVKEANRILGKNKYTLYDRRNPLKSHEMFLVVQNYHNPEKDVEKAVKLHNKGKRYFEEVMDRYNCLKLHQEILKFKNR